MAIYSFDNLSDETINCVLARKPEIRKYVQDQGGKDRITYIAALNNWWNLWAHTWYVSLDGFLNEVNCPISLQDTGVAQTPTPMPSPSPGLLENPWVLAGGAALLLFLMFGRR